MSKTIGNCSSFPRHQRCLYIQYERRLLNGELIEELTDRGLRGIYLGRAITGSPTTRDEGISFWASAYAKTFMSGAANEVIKTRDFPLFHTRMDIVQHAHSGNRQLLAEVEDWAQDALLMEGRYTEWWSRSRASWEAHRTGQYLDPGDFVWIRPQCTENTIDHVDLARSWRSWSNQHRLQDVAYAWGGQVDQQLREYEDCHDENYIQGLYSSATRCKGRISRYRKVFRGKPSGYADRGPARIQLPGVKVSLVDEIERSVSGLLHECLNHARIECGLPAIGGGWVGETELFHRVKKLFPTLEVIHHARPTWLVLTTIG